MKTYQCDYRSEWYDWEAQYWDEYKLRKHQDDLEEIAWQEYERRRMERSNMDCGYTPDEDENEVH